MGLFSKLKKTIKKIDPVGSKLHETHRKIQTKTIGKSPIGKKLMGAVNKMEGNLPTKPAASKTTTKPAMPKVGVRPAVQVKKLPGKFNKY